MLVYKKRFDELYNDLVRVEGTKRNEHSEHFGNIESVDEEAFDTVRLKIRCLIASICGNDSEYYKEYIEAEKVGSFDSSYDRFKRVNSVFKAVKEDYENGYLNTIKMMIQAEVFSDQIEQAQELLKNGYYVAAAIISGIVLETKLRELCAENNIEIGKLDKMNADLAKKGIYNSIIQKQIVAIAAIRNSAAHGKYDEFSEEQIKSMISQVINILSSL